MKTEAETGGRQPQAKDTWTPRNWKRQEGPSLEPPRGSTALPTHGLQTLGLQTVRESIAVVLTPPPPHPQFMVLCYGRPRTLLQSPRPGRGWPIGECATLPVNYLRAIPTCSVLLSQTTKVGKQIFMCPASLASRSHCIIPFWPTRPKYLCREVSRTLLLL